MTDEPVKTELEVKSATDLKLEQMEQSIAAMRENYESQVKELTEANKDLWSALHPVKDEGRTYIAEDPRKPVACENLKPQADVLNEMVRKKLGIATQNPS